MVKILIAHDRLLSFGGGERVALILQKIFNSELVVAGFKPNHHYKDLPEDKIINLKAWNTNKKGLIPLAINIFRSIYRFRRFRHDSDIIICSGMWSLCIKKYKKKVLYMHSPPREIYDLKQFYARQYKGITKLCFYIYALIREMYDQKIINEADLIICNSKNVKQRIKRYYQRESIVINPVSSENFYFNHVGDYWLIVSRLEDIKRVNLAIEVFKEIPYEKLVIVGNATYGNIREYEEKIKDLPNIRMDIDVSEIELKTLYSNCRATLHLAQFEDYGLTINESFKSGKPVVVLDDSEGFAEQVFDFNGIIIKEPYTENLIKCIKNWNIYNWDYQDIKEYGDHFNMEKFEKEIKNAIEKVSEI